MLAERFPDSIRYGASGGPAFQTRIVRVLSGRESRNRDWSEMRHRYDVSQCIKTNADFDIVRAHFINAGGRELAFPFKDHADYTVSFSEGRAVSITSTTFRLQKLYQVGSASSLRDIRLPRNVSVLVSGSPATISVDADTGVVTIASAPDPENITWAGEFDVLVRYDTDELRAQIISKSGDELVMDWSGIPLVEVTDE